MSPQKREASPILQLTILKITLILAAYSKY